MADTNIRWDATYLETTLAILHAKDIVRQSICWKLAHLIIKKTLT